MINQFKLESLKNLSTFFPKRLILKELELLGKKVTLVNNRKYVSQEDYLKVEAMLVSKGYSKTKTYSFSDIVKVSLKEGFITDSKVLELLQKEGLLKRYLIQVPFSKRKIYSHKLVEDIKNSMNNGGVLTLAKKGSKTIRVVTEETGLSFNTISNLISILELDIQTYNSIYLFTESEISTLIECKDLVKSKSIFKKPIVIDKKEYITSNYFKKYLKEKGIELRDIQYLFNTDVLYYVLKGYKDEVVRVTAKEELDLFLEYSKLNKSKLNNEEALFLLYTFQTECSYSKAFELLKNSVNLQELITIISLNYKTYSKLSSSLKRERLLEYLSNIGVNISKYTKTKVIKREVFNKIHLKSILGTLKITEDGYISSLLLSKLTGFKSKYLVEREKNLGNKVLSYDFTTDKYLNISTLSKEEQLKIKEYSELTIKEQLKHGK